MFTLSTPGFVHLYKTFSLQISHVGRTMCAATFSGDLKAAESVMPHNAVVSWMVVRVLKILVWRQMWGHGIGRHTKNEIRSIGMNDLKAISFFLGDPECFTLLACSAPVTSLIYITIW